MKALAIDPNNANTYARLGLLYEIQEMLPEALEQYQRYLELAGEEADPEIVEHIKSLESKFT